MNILICIDDTDNLDSLGTGHLAAEFAQLIETRAWGKTSFITRHQLFVHSDIAFTSHNSAMCFAASIDSNCREALIDEAGRFLAQRSAPGSSPGLCVAVTTALAEASALIGFGQAAKGLVLTKNDAYVLAQRQGIHLSEHGGTGQGVIGALAGAGLRLSGNDGRIRGGRALLPGTAPLSVKALLALPEVNAVQTRAGETLPDDVVIELGDRLKTVLLNGRATLLVTLDLLDGKMRWRCCNKPELRCH